MDKKDFINLIKGVKSAYPNFKFVDTPEGLEMWFSLLQDIPYKNLSLAFQKHIATSKYPPSINEIREIALNPEPIKDWSEGWGIVLYCIRNYGYYQIKEAMDYMWEEDQVTYSVMKRLNFKEVCISEDLSRDRANFRMAYENERKYSREKKAIPQHVKDGLTALVENLNMEALNDDEIEGLDDKC